VADQRDYAACAVRADERAEAALSPRLADALRRVAKSYWALARQQTEIKYREWERMPKIEDPDA
jgi:hypothetical protein